MRALGMELLRGKREVLELSGKVRDFRKRYTRLGRYSDERLGESPYRYTQFPAELSPGLLRSCGDVLSESTGLMSGDTKRWAWAGLYSVWLTRFAPPQCTKCILLHVGSLRLLSLRPQRATLRRQARPLLHPSHKRRPRGLPSFIRVSF